MPIAPLREALSTLLVDPQDLVLARSILETTDVFAIATRVEDFVRAAIDRVVVGCTLFTQSVGAVFALVLDDGSHVVLKAHSFGDGRRSPSSLRELQALYAAQALFAEAAFPCARVVAMPRSWPGGAAALMTHLPGAPADDPHQAPVRTAMAEGLWHSVGLGRRVHDADLPRSSLPQDTLFGRAHNALFDLAAPGGEWIDERARQARTILEAADAPPVVMHTDFSGANVRVTGGRIFAVYDMDSLASCDEMRCLASAAVHYTYVGDRPSALPTRDEACAFVEDYLKARGRPLDAGERARLDAAAIYAMAYTARCEHSLGSSERVMGDALRSAPAAYFR